MDYKNEIKKEFLNFKAMEENYLIMKEKFESYLTGKTIFWNNELWKINEYHAGVLELESEDGMIIYDHIEVTLQ